MFGACASSGSTNTSARKLGRRAAGSWPSERTVPALANSNPEMSFSSVDLPAPLTPSKPIDVAGREAERELLEERAAPIAERETVDVDHVLL